MTIPAPITRWFARHAEPTCLALHVFGVPTCFVSAPLLAIVGLWKLAGLLFLAGYAAQFLGHVIQGDRSGEEMLVRRLLRR